MVVIDDRFANRLFGWARSVSHRPLLPSPILEDTLSMIEPEGMGTGGLVRAQEAWATALELWQDDEDAFDFLTRKHAMLEDQTPIIAAIKSSEGLRSVQSIIWTTEVWLGSMSGQKTNDEIVCYRIGDARGSHPIFDARGSTIAPGRWNTSLNPVIYTSLRYSTSLLEKLVYSSGVMPPNQHYIEITIPSGLTYEYFSIFDPSNNGWDDPSPSISKSYGDKWISSSRSLLLIVPSVIARVDENILINPAHPEFRSVRPASFNKPVHWDKRLFGSTSAPP